MSSINIIGSGFSSLAAACYLAQEGHEVKVFEKNDSLGGRARIYQKDGFTFDMGPSWYWMPDIFERFFADFNKKPSDYFELKKLTPSYRIYFGDNDSIDIHADIETLKESFEKIEKGSAKQLEIFLAKAESNYNIAMGDLVYEPGVSPLELVTKDTVRHLGQFFSTISSDIRSRFKDERLRQALEFPVLFLGAKPEDTPSFYSFMNHADLNLGTWYPMGGMYEVVKAMVDLAASLGVEFKTNSNVDEIVTAGNKAIGIISNGLFHEADIQLSGADYAHTESLLNKDERMYTQKYWQNKTFAPSALLFYVGFDTKIQNVLHHTLFFDAKFKDHAIEIYDDPKWPNDPLFYASFSSKTDKSVAPEGKEAAVFLIPLAPDLDDSEEMRAHYFDIIIDRLEKHSGQPLKDHILFSESYGVNDFKQDYNSYKGNAYGMANTLMQTAFLRPKIKSKKVEQLYFTGQLTVPGPGVPPSLISGKIASTMILKDLKKKQHARPIS